MLVTIHTIKVEAQLALSDGSGLSTLDNSTASSKIVKITQEPVTLWKSSAELSTAAGWVTQGSKGSKTDIYPCGVPSNNEHSTGDDDEMGAETLLEPPVDCSKATAAALAQNVTAVLVEALECVREYEKLDTQDANDLWHRSKAELAVLDIALALEVDASFWSSVPAEERVECLDAVQDLMHIQLVHIAVHANNPLTSVQLTVLLTTATIIDMLTGSIAPHLPSVITPWMLGLLGVPWDPAIDLRDVSPIVAQGPWRTDLIILRSYWQSRLPSVGPSIAVVGPLDEALRPPRHYTETLAGWIAAHPTLARAATADDDSAVLATVQSMLALPSSSDTNQIALNARVRAAKVLNVFQTTDLHACQKKNPKDPVFAQTPAALRASLDVVLSNVEKRCNRKQPPHRSIDTLWGKAVIKSSYSSEAVSDKEALLHWPAATGSRGALRNFEPRFAGLMTPITMQEQNLHDLIFQHGTQEVRELATIGANSSLQITSTASHFASRHCDLLIVPKLRMLIEILTVPGAFESNIKLDDKLPNTLEELCQKGYALGLSLPSKDENVPATFGYLQILFGHLLTSPQVSAGLSENKTNTYADLSSTLQAEAFLRFGELLNVTSMNETKSKVQIHYWRARSFEGCSVDNLTHKNVRFFASSLNMLLANKASWKEAGFPNEAMVELFDGVSHLDMKAKTLIEAGGGQEVAERDRILNQIMVDEFPTLGYRVWQKDGLDRYRTSDKVCRYNSFRGNIACYEKGEVEVPVEFQNDEVFRNLFPGLLTVREMNATNMFKHTEKDIEYEFLLVNHKPIIHRYMDSELKTCAQAVKSEFVGPMKDLAAWDITDTITWVYIDGQVGKPVARPLGKSKATRLLLTDKKGGALLQLDQTKEGSWHAGHPDNVANQLATANFIALMFHRIEQPSHTFVFAQTSTQNITAVMLPRFRLTFTANEDGCLAEPTKGFIICNGDSQYLTVSGPTRGTPKHSGAVSIGAESGFGDFQAYLLVRKKSGERGVLMPVVNETKWNRQTHDGLGTPTATSITLEAVGMFSADGSYTTVPFYYYKLRKNLGGSADTVKTYLEPEVTDSHERVMALAHVATILLSERQYSGTGFYLELIDRTLKRSRTTSVDEMNSLKRIANFAAINNDHTPAAVAVRFKAFAIIRRKMDNKMEQPFGTDKPKLLRSRWGGWEIKLTLDEANDSILDALCEKFGDNMQESSADVEHEHKTTKIELKISVDMTKEEVESKIQETFESNSVTFKMKDLEIEKVDPPFADVKPNVYMDLEKLEAYYVNLNRVPMDLRLSKERFKSAFGTIAGYDKYNAQPNASRFDLWETNKPDLYLQKVDIHPFDTGANVPRTLLRGWNDGIPIPMLPATNCRGVFELEPRFGKAFPQELHPVYAMLKDSTDIRARKARKVAKDLGIFESPNKIDVGVGNFGLKQAATTFVELRYRYLSSILTSDADSKTLNDTLKEHLVAEVQLLEVLFRAAKDQGFPTETVEDWADKEAGHTDLMAVHRVIPGYVKFVEKVSSLTTEVTNDIVDESVEVWKKWIGSVKPRIQEQELSITKVSEPNRVYAPVGPFPLQQLPRAPDLKLTATPPLGDDAIIAIQKPDEPARRVLTLVEGKCADVTVPPKWKMVGKDDEDTLLTEEDYNDIIRCEKVPRNMENTASPFAAGANSEIEGFAKRIFSKYNKRYLDYTSDLAQTEECKFDWNQLVSSKERIRGLNEKLKKRLASTAACLELQTERLHNNLNMNYTDSGRRYHRHIRVMRGARPVLRLGDINTALVLLQSQGAEKAARHLHKLNKNINFISEINAVLGIGLDVLRVKREKQRLERGIGAIEELLGGKHKDGSDGLDAGSQDFDFAKHAGDVRTVLSEKIEYDPFEEPTLLVVETELDLGLWRKQVPAIRSLAPGTKDRRACLYELAMGMGKSAVITPAVINLLADGTTLPILVMPESLVPSMADELQMQMGKGIDREIRVLPIDRVKHTAADIDHLREELEMMIDDAVPLVWSSNDIQTLINSWIEDMEKQRCTNEFADSKDCLAGKTVGGGKTSHCNHKGMAETVSPAPRESRDCW